MTRPPLSAQGSQRWHRLLFSHWEVAPDVLRARVPEPLELDAFDGRYYVGVVAFQMQDVRPLWWAPPIPSAREFGEVNLRTYVRLRDGEPGVFFFSLDAASSLVVWAARTFWNLPYHRARVAARYDGQEVEYRCRRRSSGLEFTARANVGDSLPPSRPDSLNFFLCERYQFYTIGRRGVVRARVHHKPYPLHAVNEASVDSSLLEAAQLPIDGARTPDLYSPGVDVEVFAQSCVSHGVDASRKHVGG